MTKQELITEGYLEAYLTEDLSKEELLVVEQFIASDVEVRTEYFRVQKTLELMAFHWGRKPSSVIKRTIMEDSTVVKNLHISSGSTIGWKLMVAASVLLTVFSSYTAVYYWGKWHTADDRLTEMISQNLQMAENMNKVNQELDHVRDNLAVLISPEFSRVVLKGTANAKTAIAVIYWNVDRQEIYLNSASLAQLPTGKQYQLWALVDGQPIDAGAFDPTGDTFKLMKAIAKADAFAITIEPEGGSISPSLETMQVYGVVEAG